jgi:hypothetical protein
MVEMMPFHENRKLVNFDHDENKAQQAPCPTSVGVSVPRMQPVCKKMLAHVESAAVLGTGVHAFDCDHGRKANGGCQLTRRASNEKRCKHSEGNRMFVGHFAVGLIANVPNRGSPSAVESLSAGTFGQ